MALRTRPSGSWLRCLALLGLMALGCACMAAPCMGKSQNVQLHRQQLRSNQQASSSLEKGHFADGVASATARKLQQASPTLSPSPSNSTSPSPSPKLNSTSPSPSPVQNATSPSPQPAWPSPSPNNTMVSPNMTSPNMTSPSPSPSPVPSPAPPPPVSVQMSMFLGGINSTQFAAMATVFKNTTMQVAFGPTYTNVNAVLVNSFVDYTYTGNFTAQPLPSPSPSPNPSPLPANNTSNITSPSPSPSPSLGTNTTSPSPSMNSTSPSPAPSPTASPTAPAGRRRLSAERPLTGGIEHGQNLQTAASMIAQTHRALQQAASGVQVSYSLVESSAIVALAVMNLKAAIDNGTYTTALRTAGVLTTGATTLDPTVSPAPASPVPSPLAVASPTPSPAASPSDTGSGGDKTYTPREVATITVCTTIGAVLFVILLALAWHWGRHLFCPSSPVQPQTAAPQQGVSGVTAMSALKPTMPPYPPSPYRPPGSPYQPPGSPYGQLPPNSPTRLPPIPGYSAMQPVNMYQPDWAAKPAGAAHDMPTTPTKTIPALPAIQGYGQLPPLQPPALPPLQQYVQQMPQQTQQQQQQQQQYAVPSPQQITQQQLTAMGMQQAQQLQQVPQQQLTAPGTQQVQLMQQAAGNTMQPVAPQMQGQLMAGQNAGAYPGHGTATAYAPMASNVSGGGNSAPGYSTSTQGYSYSNPQAPAYR